MRWVVRNMWSDMTEDVKLDKLDEEGSWRTSGGDEGDVED